MRTLAHPIDHVHICSSMSRISLAAATKLLVGLCLTAVSAACSLSDAEQEDVDRWLTCVECTDGERERVAEIAAGFWKEKQTIERLVEALQAPRLEQTRNMRSRFAESHSRLVAPPISSSAYVNHFERNYQALHQKRAALALGDIRTPVAIGAIFDAATRPTAYRGDVLQLMGEILIATNGAAIATTLVAVPPTTYVVRTGASATPTPTVRAADAAGNPVAGVVVNFTPILPSTAEGTTVTTNSSGLASVGRWVAGPTDDSASLVVQSPTVSDTVIFTALVTFGANIEIAAGAGQSATAGTAVPIDPAVTITDASGTALPGVKVDFLIVTGGGSLTGSSPVIDPNGIAQVGSWTLGLGANRLMAVAAGLPPVTFVATGTP